MGTSNSNFTPPTVFVPDNTKQVFSQMVVFEAGPAPIVSSNPPNVHQSVSIYNQSPTKYLKVEVGYEAGVSFAGGAIEHSIIVPPLATENFDLSSRDSGASVGNIPPIAKLDLTLFDAPSAAGVINGFTAVPTANNPSTAVIVLNYYTT